jgi:hypothetical protein
MVEDFLLPRLPLLFGQDQQCDPFGHSQGRIRIVSGLPVESIATVQAPTRSARKEDRSPPLWAPEVLIPSQFFQPTTDSARMWTGERRLLFAVLHNAVESLFRYQHDYSLHGRRLFKEAHDWFWSTHAWGLCSFETICPYLHLDVDYIRRGLRRLYDPTTVSFAPVVKAPRKPHDPNLHLTVVRDEKIGKP